VGKLDGSIKLKSEDRLIARLEAEIVELRSERNMYRDIVLVERKMEEPPHTMSEVDPSEFYKGTTPVRNWRTAKKILTRAALLKKERKEQPVHIGRVES